MIGKATMGGEISKNGAQAWLMLALLLCASSAVAQFTDPTADRLPPQLSDVAIEQRLDQQVPLQIAFREETGATVHLSEYFHSGKPVILTLVYYNCQMMCSEVLSSLAGALRRVKFDAGNQFEVLTVSFDPREKPELAARAKSKYLAMYQRPGAERGWHFLTGDQSSITALADAVGFHFRWDARSNQFAHATGIMLLTPEGRVAQYYYGARYFPSDLRLGLVEASQNRIATLADQIILFCYHYDRRTGRYGAIVSRVIQVSGGFTLLVLSSIIVFMIRTDPNRRKRKRSDGFTDGHGVNPRFARQRWTRGEGD